MTSSALAVKATRWACRPIGWPPATLGFTSWSSKRDRLHGDEPEVDLVLGALPGKALGCRLPPDSPLVLVHGTSGQHHHLLGGEVQNRGAEEVVGGADGIVDGGDNIGGDLREDTGGDWSEERSNEGSKANGCGQAGRTGGHARRDW